MSLLDLTKVPFPSLSLSFSLSLTPSFLKHCVIHTETHQPTHFDPEDGGSMYLRNVDSIAYIHALKYSQKGISNNN
jgi:hypothetical protein